MGAVRQAFGPECQAAADCCRAAAKLGTARCRRKARDSASHASPIARSRNRKTVCVGDAQRGIARRARYQFGECVTTSSLPWGSHHVSGMIRIRTVFDGRRAASACSSSCMVPRKTEERIATSMTATATGDSSITRHARGFAVRTLTPAVGLREIGYSIAHHNVVPMQSCRRERKDTSYNRGYRQKIAHFLDYRGRAYSDLGQIPSTPRQIELATNSRQATQRQRPQC